MAPKIFCNVTRPRCPILNLMLNKDYYSEIYLFFEVACKDLKSIEKLIFCVVFLALLPPPYNFIIMVLPQQTLSFLVSAYTDAVDV